MAAVTRAIQRVICSICRSSLLEQRNVVASSTCGHVFHKSCIEQWRFTSISSTGNVSCPKCRKRFANHEKYIRDLFLDSEDSTEYAKLESAKRALENDKATLSNNLRKLKEAKDLVETERQRLQIENEMLENRIKMLVNEKRQLVYDNERTLKDIIQQNERTMERNTQIETENKNLVEKNKKLVEEMELLKEEKIRENEALATEVSKLSDENREQRKRMITAEIKVILLTNQGLLEETHGDLKWSDLTDTFQKELLRKLQNSSGCSWLNFDEVLPINSKALLRLIKADDRNEMLLQNMIEDYFEEMVQSNGKVSWDDLGSSFRQYVISKLRESSHVGSLQLSQVPISSKIVARLIKDKYDHNPYLLGEIVTSYLGEVENWSVLLINDMLKVALLELINDRIIDEVKLWKPLDSEDLVVPALLRQVSDLVYEFEHDSVKYWVIGTIISKLMEQIKISRMQAIGLIHKRRMSADSLGIYFVDYMCEAEPRNVTNFTAHTMVYDTLDLLMILCVMKLPSLQALRTTLKYFKNSNLLVTFRLKSHDFITLLHAAAFRGELDVVKCLLYEHGFSEDLTSHRFQNLMVACVENTKNCRFEQIQQREEIINELIKLNRNFSKWDPPRRSVNAHEGLVEFVIGLENH